MPQLQVIENLRGPKPPETPNAAQQNLERFFTTIGDRYRADKDKSEIDRILGDYQQHQNDVNAFQNTQLELERSDISPSKRLQVQQNLNEQQKVLIERQKVINAQAKAAAGPKKTQASQPIDPEQMEKIKAVRNNPAYKNASPTAKYQMLTDNDVSKENAKAEVDIAIEEQKLGKPGDVFAEGREKAVLEYVNHSIETAKDAEEMKYVLDVAEQAVNGDVAGPGFQALAKNNPYAQLFTGLTPDEATLVAANKKLLEGAKGIFGSKPTEREIFLLLNSMLPSIGKTKEANMAGLTFLKNLNEIKLMHSDIVDELTEGGTKFIPDLERQVAERMRPVSELYRDQLRQAKQALNPAQEQKQPEKKPETKPGFVQVKDPQGVMRWIPEDVAKQQGLL